MDYVVEMRLADSGRPTTTPQEGMTCIEPYVLPTLELCKRLEAGKKIVAGGPVSGAIALTMIVRVESLQELDEPVESLPIWPRMETTIIPLTSFDGRILTIRPRLERLQASIAAQGTGEAYSKPASALDVHFINTLPVLVASRHSRESGNPGDERHRDWMPAYAGMTFYWRRTYETDI